LSTLVVLLPVASFHLPEGLNDKASLVHRELKASAETTGDLMSIKISSTPDDPVGHVMGVLGNGSSFIKQAEGHRVFFSLAEAKTIRELRLFP
jgi:hypothetical protein